MPYKGYSNFEVYSDLERLAVELEVAQVPVEVLQCAYCSFPLYLAEKIHRVPIPNKRALHKPAHHDGSAVAYLCDKCKMENREPMFALHREQHFRGRCVQVNIQDLPDL